MLNKGEYVSRCSVAMPHLITYSPLLTDIYFATAPPILVP